MNKNNKLDIDKAIKRPGALSAKAKRAGVTTNQYARQHKNDSSLTGKQARFYLNVLKK